MMSREDKLAALERGRVALLAARARYRDASTDEQRWASFVEFLMWATALDDTYHGAGCREAYEAYRDGDPDGRVILGWRLPRNASAHGLSPLIQQPPETPAGVINLAQPTFVELEILEAHLGRTPTQGQKERFAGQRKRPVRYQMRSIVTFFCTGAPALKRFIVE